jgi:UPF0755 protein
MKKAILVLLSIVIILPIISFVGAYLYYASVVYGKVNVSENKEFAIEMGSSVEEIGNQLKDLGLIKSTFILKVYLYLNSDKSLQAGYYQVKAGDMSLPEIVDVLQSGSFETKLTFIEGWRIEEYIDHARKIMGDEFADEFEKADLKEGYMFPDTYVVAADNDPKKLAILMKDHFEDKAKDGDWEQRAFEKGFTLDEVIIMASILEREMHIAKDREIVAGILIKRWQEGWPIQADATIQYAKGNSKDWWPTVTRADLQGVNSPYNTYLNKGIIPAPICNPSASSIEAVLNYKESDYWFYITGNDGTTHYAVTLDQHNQNVSQYIK